MAGAATDEVAGRAVAAWGAAWGAAWAWAWGAAWAWAWGAAWAWASAAADASGRTTASGLRGRMAAGLGAAAVSPPCGGETGSSSSSIHSGCFGAVGGLPAAGRLLPPVPVASAAAAAAAAVEELLTLSGFSATGALPMAAGGFVGDGESDDAGESGDAMRPTRDAAGWLGASAFGGDKRPPAMGCRRVASRLGGVVRVDVGGWAFTAT
jgi:hypothetical protein